MCVCVCASLCVCVCLFVCLFVCLYVLVLVLVFVFVFMCLSVRSFVIPLAFIVFFRCSCCFSLFSPLSLAPEGCPVFPLREAQRRHAARGLEPHLLLLGLDLHLGARDPHSVDFSCRFLLG